MLKITPKQITLSNPCQENWEAMTSVHQGRHCAACCKTVVDFSLMNDGEIIDLIKRSKGNLPCGHFQNSQLGRELIDTRYRPSITGAVAQKVAAMFILLQTFAVAALAQQAKGRPASVYSNGNNVKPAKKMIRGKVIDVASGLPMQGIKVKISRTGLETLTDRSGKFSLMLSSLTAADTITLVGYPDYAAATESDSFFIVEQNLSPADVASGKEIILYKYPADTLPVHNVTTYRKPLVSQYDHSGGVMTVSEIRRTPVVYKYGAWYRITHPFRKRVARADD